MTTVKPSEVGSGALGDHGEGGPVKIGAAEGAPFCGEGGGGLGRFVHEVILFAGGDVAGEAVDGGELEEVGGFDDAVPAEGVDGIGADGGSLDLDVAVVGGAGEVFGVEALEAADGPKDEDADKGEGWPKPRPRKRSRRAPISELMRPKSAGARRPMARSTSMTGSMMKTKEPGVPAGVEGKEGTEAVVVGPIEQEMAEKSHEGEEIQLAPADGKEAALALAVLLGCAGGNVAGIAFAAASPAVPDPDDGEDHSGVDGEAEEGVGPAAMMGEAGDGTAEGPDGVEVGSLGGEDHGEGGVGGAAIEAGAGEAGAGEAVRQRVHESSG